MASAEISSTGTIAYVWSGSQWIPISGDVDEQSIINSASAAAYSSASTYVDSEINSLTTTDIEEGSNLYFTNQRAIDAASATYILQSEEQNIINTASAAASSYTDSAISSLVDSAPDLLNTLNELAEALGDDENFASNIINTISSASANAITESNNYTDQEILSASSSLINYTDQEISALEVFSNIATSPSTQLITGDSNSDTLTFIAGENISISADSSTDSITINSTGEYTSVDSIEYPDYITFDTSPETIPTAPGSLYWNSADRTLDLIINNDVTLQIGREEQYPPVINKSGENIAKGDLVMVTGVQGDQLMVAKAVTDGSVNPDYIIGFATNSIPDDYALGSVIKFGYVGGIDTDAYQVGTILYADPANPGKLTNVKPDAPAYRIPIAIVAKKGNVNSSRTLVRMSPSSALGETDSNVKFTNLQNEDLLVYNSASSLWINNPVQDYINTASAAAYASASAYTNSASSSLIDYTDGEITTLTGVLASASAQAILDANSYTDGEVATSIVTASAAAAGYTDSEINSLTTLDIEENTNLYYTNDRALNTASTALVHNNHNNITASYDSGEIILSATSSGSAYAVVNTENTEPTPVDGLLYFNPNTFIFSVAYGGSWFDLATGVVRDLDGGSSTSSFLSTIDGGDSSTSEFTYSYDGGTSN